MFEMSERQKVEGGLRLFERLIGAIPGFKGYKQKEVRRESDRLVRTQAAVNLSQALDVFKRSLAASKPPLSEEKMRVANEVSARLDGLKEKTSKALGGYSGFFDAVKVKEEKLDQVLELDYGLITQSKAIGELAVKVSRVDTSSPEWKMLTDELKERVDRFEESLRERERILSTP